MSTDPSTVAGYAAAIMTAVRHDMAHPFAWGKQIPVDVGSYSALHDYCDANGYVMQTMPESIWGDAENDASNELVNAVMDEADRQLRDLAARVSVLTSWAHGDCGGTFTFHERFATGFVLACAECGQHRVVPDDPQKAREAMARFADALITAADAATERTLVVTVSDIAGTVLYAEPVGVDPSGSDDTDAHNAVRDLAYVLNETG